MRAILVLMALGCATRAASSGSVTFQQIGTRGTPPISFSVGDRHVVGSDLDIREDDQGCIRGAWGRVPLDFCRDDKGQGLEQHWSGASGSFTVAPNGPDGVAVVGSLILDTGRAVEMNQEVKLRQGSGWDELRRHPALAALAATAAEMQASHLRR